MGQWQSQPLCNTPACVHAAANILQNLHPQWKDMDPCTDFGEMVCHGFKQHTPVDLESLSYAARDNKRMLMSIFESPNHVAAAGLRSTYLTTRGADHDEYNFDMLRTAYKTCMDTTAATAAGSQPLTDFLVSINETWPVTDFTSKVGSDYDGLLKATLMLEEFGIPALRNTCQTLSLVGNPWADPDKKLNHPCISTPAVTLPVSSFTNPTQVQGLVATYAQAFKLLYPTLGMEEGMKMAEAATAFEADIAKLLLPFEGQRDPGDGVATLKQMSLAEANAAAPALNFEKMLTVLAGKRPSTVLLDMPSFWPEYSNIISKHPKAAIQGFMALKAAIGLINHVEFPELRKVFRAPAPGERGLDCVDSLTAIASELVDSYFVKAAYNEQSRKTVDKIATNVIAAFKNRVGELEWLGDESRQRAVKKVEGIVRNIGYRTDKTINPDITSGESLAAYYRGLNITTASHFANMLAGMRDSTAKAYALSDQPMDFKSFLKPVSGPNALYYMPANSINIPAGITQLPAFHHQLPSYALYGGVGSFIGHEITHGFDSNGRKWNENATYVKWWDDKSSNNFDDLTQCFIKQYDSYEVDVPSGKASVNGTFTLAENISDAGGLRAAYDAWLAERKAMPSSWNQDLPGLDMFTHEQLFFMMWGNNWCSSYSESRKESMLTNDNHAPASARLALTAQNSRGFKEAFKCKTKEPTCEIF